MAKDQSNTTKVAESDYVNPDPKDPTSSAGFSAADDQLCLVSQNLESCESGGEWGMDSWKTSRMVDWDNQANIKNSEIKLYSSLQISVLMIMSLSIFTGKLLHIRVPEWHDDVTE